jgi:hypothetical protein
LERYALRGWHCTRLTDHEIATILREGFARPDGSFLRKRLERAVADGVLRRELADFIWQNNRADEEGRVWVAFFRPPRDGAGVYEFFRYWGGEAMYWHLVERSPDAAAALTRIGTPCVVEVAVPFSAMRPLDVHFWPEKLYRLYARFLAAGGTVERFEGFVTEGLAANHVIEVHRYPSAQFMELTGCAEWEPGAWTG